VLVGNHRDAWILGALDPSSGTAAMLEMARAFSKMRQDHGTHTHAHEKYDMTTTFSFGRVLSSLVVI
jgi:Zn-dependent M28 family amino/carboxypeptidase